MITARDLTFTYGGRKRPTLVEVNFTIGEGEFVLLTGPTGCGKSTLLKTLNGLIPHHSEGCLTGMVEIDGLVTENTTMSALTRKVGMVFQSPEDQLFATLVEDEVAFGPENLCLSKTEIENRIEQALLMVGMSKAGCRSTVALSGGEKQRVAIASILAMQPKILALDEPLSQLDPQGAREILAVLQALNKNGMTIVIIEHRLPEVIHLVNRVMVMKEGRILLDQPKEEALRQTSLFDALGLIPPSSPRLTMVELMVKSKGRGNGHNLRNDSQNAPNPAPFYTSTRDEETAVSAEDLWFRYSKKSDYSLRGVSIKIKRGEVVAIIGNNGTGKSTLLLHLATVLTPEKGRVIIGGNGHRRLNPYRLAGKVGTMFQNSDLLLFSSTVRQEVEFGPRALCFTPELIKKIASDILRALNIAHLEEDIPQGLSKGQRLRVAAASILSLKPELVLLDEPTCGQDRIHIQGLMGYLRDLASMGLSAVFITHHLETAQQYADRILIMEEGRISSEIIQRRESQESTDALSGMVTC